MAEKSEAPQFGEWEKKNVEYTDYFERASKGRNGARNKPNGLKDTKPDEPKVQYAVRATTPKHVSDKDDNNNNINSNDGAGRRATLSPRHHNHQRTPRTNTGSDRSFEQSPLHAHARVTRGGGGAVSSPSWERKGGGSAESSGHGGVVPPTTPGRSRLRQSATRGDETSDDGGATVPKFGDWDESDPSAAEGFTQVFEKIRDEKNSAGKLTSTPTGSSNALKRGSTNDTSKGCFCFPWGRK